MTKKKFLFFIIVFLVVISIVIGGASLKRLLKQREEIKEKSQKLIPNENIKIRGLDVHMPDKKGIAVAKNAGANWVGLMYFVEVDWDTGKMFEPRWGSQKRLRKMIREAKKQGLKVLLQIYPEYYIEGAPPGYSHAIELEHGPFKNQEGFLKKATDLVLEIAKLAEEEKVDMFSPWCEMNIFVDWEHSKKWTQEILPKIRKVYSGLVAPPKGEITWRKYGLKNEGDLSYWDFSGYDYVWADVFDSDYHLNGLQGSCKNEKDYRRYIRTLLSFLQKLKEKSGAKGIILGSEIGVPEQLLARKVKKIESEENLQKIIENFWRILFEETYKKVEGYFFYPWRGKQHLATNISFKADFSRFFKKYYFQIEPKIEWLRGIGFAGIDILEAKEMGANIVHLAVFPKILKNYDIIVLSDHSDLPLEEMKKMEAKTKEEMREKIRKAHSLGLKVYLSLYPEFLHTHLGEIPAGKDREKFLEKMEEIALDWARFAEEEKVEIYSPTTALYSFVGQKNEEKWQAELFPKIRKIYSGELSSRAFEFYIWNHSQKRWIERENVHFDFSPYDYIGLNFFGGEISDEKIFRQYIRKNLQKAVELMKKYQLKGITLGEIGYPHTKEALERIMKEKNVSLEKALFIARQKAWQIVIEEIKGKPYIIPFFSNVQAEETDVWLGEERRWIRFSKEDIEATKKLVSSFFKEKFSLKCDDFNPCTEDFLLGGECFHRPLSGPLDGCKGKVEEEKCGFFSCVEGKCLFKKRYFKNCCNDDNEGTLDIYDNNSGRCIHKPKIKRWLLKDEFSNLSFWKKEEGTWQIQKGKAIGRGRSNISLEGFYPQNFYLKLKARVLRGSFCVTFREADGKAYDVILEDVTTSLINLEGPDVSQFYSDNLDLRSWFELEIIAYKDKIDVYFNGKKIISAKTKNYPKGKIHLRTWNTQFSGDKEAKSEVEYLILGQLD